MLFKNIESLIRAGWRLEVKMDTISPRFHAVIHKNDRNNGHNHIGMTVNQAVNGLEQYLEHALRLETTATETRAEHAAACLTHKGMACDCGWLNERR